MHLQDVGDGHPILSLHLLNFDNFTCILLLVQEFRR